METHNHKLSAHEQPTSSNPPCNDEQQQHPHRRLPEREVLRRLWRIYEMALAAASRVEAQDDEPHE